MENNFNEEYIHSLIAKKLAGEASDADLQEIEAWKNASEENAAYLAQFENIWNHSNEQDIFSAKTESAWNKVLSRMHKPSDQRIRVSYRAAISIAASVAILFAVWFFWPKNEQGKIAGANSQPKGIHIEAGDSLVTAELPDKTLVILQPHSRLDADSQFNKTHRNMHLQGDAYFKTRHGEKFVFTVITNALTVRDIGTAFHVKTTSFKPSVIVTQGSVMVQGQRDSVLLVRGDTALFDQQTLTLEKHEKTVPKSESDLDKKDKTLVFEDTELEKVVEILNATFQSQIRIGSDKIRYCKVTTSFKNESLERVLEVLQESLDLVIRHEGNSTIIYGKGCK